MSEPTIIITGASGGIGGRAARQLADQGARLRLVVRDAARAPQLAGAEVAVTDFDDPDGLRRAFEGAATVLFVSAAENEHRLAQHYRVADAAGAAGVGHVVYTSFLGAAPDATFTLARDHFHTERRIEATGVGHTFLRDSLYIDVFPHFVGSDGVLRGPAGDGRLAPVARDDVADAAAAVLADPKAHDGRTYDLTGPALLDLAEIAALISAASGRTVRYEAETLEEAYASRAGYGAPGWEVAGWVTSYAAIAAGEMAVVSDAVEAITGHAATTVAAWLASRKDL